MTDERRIPTDTRREPLNTPGDFLAEGMLFGADAPILRQEAQGQAEIVESDVLPKKCDPESRAALEAAGVVFGETVPGEDVFGELFVYVMLPPGWRKIPTDHALWSHLVDAQGHVRAHIGYKAAFYDRWAQLSAVPRYSGMRDYAEEYLPDPGQNYPRWGIVKDGETVIQRFGPFGAVEGLEWFRDQRAEDTARAWLDEHYPEWRSLTAYWD